MTQIHPVLEDLGGRVLLSGGLGRRSELGTVLFTPIPDGKPLAEHIHPHLTIIVEGQMQTIPAGIGLLAEGALPIHTHTGSGTLHIESTRVLPFRLRDFFSIWGQAFTSRNVLGHQADGQHQITMTVNGRSSQAFGHLLLRDHQQIVIEYGLPVAGGHKTSLSR